MAPLAANAEDPRQIPLVDQDGMVFRLAGLRGEPVVLTFVASRCRDACPLADALFARLSSRLAHDGLPARLVTITLDPDYDTPRVMARVARRYRAVANLWRFASGKPADVRRLMRALGVETTQDPRGIPELHTTFAYILDRRIRLADTLFLSPDLVNEVEDALRRVNL
jgi:protein SCO1/2